MAHQKPGITNMVDWQKWAQEQIAGFDHQVMANKLVEGKGQKVIFSPFLGEFGHRCIFHARYVHFLDAKEKIVCCPKGLEALYPSATAFEYDFTDPIPDSEKAGTDRYIREWPALAAKYPTHKMLQSGGLSMSQEWIVLRPENRIPFKFKSRNLTRVDVCLSTRARGFLPDKNWAHMQLVADALTAKRYTFATIGREPTSYHLNGEKYFSGDFGDIDASIELIAGAQHWFSQDTGTAHLAAAVGIDQTILNVPDVVLGVDLNRTRTFFQHMTQVNVGHKMYEIGRPLWNEPQQVIEQLLAHLPPPRQPEALQMRPEPQVVCAPIKGKKRPRGK